MILKSIGVALAEHSKNNLKIIELNLDLNIKDSLSISNSSLGCSN